jgi:acyl transferase domain-containing protein
VLERPAHLLTLSSKSAEALKALAARYVEYLEGEFDGNLADICNTANNGRAHLRHRLAVVARNCQGLATELRRPEALVRGVATRTPPRIAFLFSGEGAQYAGMGRSLYDTAPAFRDAVDQCAALLKDFLDVPLTTVLWGETNAQLDETRYAQPALFALEYALAALWQSWGIKPAVVIGHGIGEVVAACIAGVFSLADGIKLIAARPLLATRAFHSSFAEAIRGIAYHSPKIPLVSSQSGGLAGPEVCTPEYWDQQIQAPMKFAEGIKAVDAHDISIYLEVGPGAALLEMGQACLSSKNLPSKNKRKRQGYPT